MISLVSRIFTKLGRLFQAASRLYWLRIISTLICVSAFLFCADTAQVAAKNPKSDSIRAPQRGGLPSAGAAGVPAPGMPPALGLPPAAINQAAGDDAENSALQEQTAQLPAAKPFVQVPAPIAEITRESKDKGYEIIIDKNIFSPERKKWVSEPAVSKQSAEKLAKKEINELILLGTVISRQGRYAALRTKKDPGKDGYKPSMQGDYIQGYLVKEIEEKKVTLQDDSDNTEYVLFINDDKKERVAEKTELKPEQPKAPAEEKKADKPARKKRERKPTKQPPIPADAPDVVRKAMEKNLQQEEKMKIAPPPADLPDTIRKAIEQEQVEGQEE